MKQHTTLVTGASSGIGEALSLALGARGTHVVLVARSEGKLQALAGLLAQKYGVTATVQAEVWMRPWDSVAGTRCTRCAPDSNFSLP